ncbi:MAG: transposase [Planctomycetota bacterium]
MLAEAWRRAVLALFVREGWLEDAAAAAMLTWPHSGFSAYVGPAIAAEDRAAVLRVARYGARAPVAESRLRYDAERAEVELAADASEGPYAGVHRMAAVEFLARLVDHIPAKGEVRTRYYGAYASRRRGWWRRRRVVLAGAGREQAADAEREAEPWPALRARRRRWAELLRWVFEVDVTVCPDPPAAGAPRRRDAHPRVRDRARGGHTHSRAPRAGRGRCTRRTMGGGGVGAGRAAIEWCGRACRPRVGEVCATSRRAVVRWRPRRRAGGSGGSLGGEGGCCGGGEGDAAGASVGECRCRAAARGLRSRGARKEIPILNVWRGGVDHPRGHARS